MDKWMRQLELSLSAFTDSTKDRCPRRLLPLSQGYLNTIFSVLLFQFLAAQSTTIAHSKTIYSHVKQRYRSYFPSPKWHHAKPLSNGKKGAVGRPTDMTWAWRVLLHFEQSDALFARLCHIASSE